jgi:hypothetical protein
MTIFFFFCLKGLTHRSLVTAKSLTRRVMTFSLLLTLGHKIANSPWVPLSKQVVWMPAVVAFFGSTCLGEILASKGKEFLPSSDLTWSDVQATIDNSLTARIKQPKSGEKEGEYVDIFSFSSYHCCRVKALKKLKELQKSAGYTTQVNLCSLMDQVLTLLQELTENKVSHIGWRPTKLSG